MTTSTEEWAERLALPRFGPLNERAPFAHCAARYYRYPHDQWPALCTGRLGHEGMHHSYRWSLGEGKWDREVWEDDNECDAPRADC